MEVNEKSKNLQCVRGAVNTFVGRIFNAETPKIN